MLVVMLYNIYMQYDIVCSIIYVLYYVYISYVYLTNCKCGQLLCSLSIQVVTMVTKSYGMGTQSNPNGDHYMEYYATISRTLYISSILSSCIHYRLLRQGHSIMRTGDKG